MIESSLAKLTEARRGSSSVEVGPCHGVVVNLALVVDVGLHVLVRPTSRLARLPAR